MAKKQDEETDTPTPRTAAPRQSAIRVKVRVTKFGGGQVSTGEHSIGEDGLTGGDVMAKAGDVLEVDQSTANSLEVRGFAETV